MVDRKKRALEESMLVACRHRLIHHYWVGAHCVHIDLDTLRLALTVDEAAQFMRCLLRGYQYAPEA